MKELPKVYENKIDKKINNTQEVFLSANSDRNDEDIYSYRGMVKITLSDREFNTYLIGNTSNYLITKNKELIKIKDIQNIVKL